MLSIVYYFINLMLFAVAYIVIADNITINRIEKGKAQYMIANTVCCLIIIGANLDKSAVTIEGPILVGIMVYRNFRKISYSIFVGVLTTLVLVLADAFIGILVVIILKDSFNNIPDDSFKNLIITIIMVGMGYFTSLGLRKILNKRYIDVNEFSSKVKVRLPVIIYLTLIIINLYLTVAIYKWVIGDLNSFLVIINAFISVGAFAAFLIVVNTENKNVRKILEQEHKDKEFKQLEEYIETVEIMSTDLRKFKHDYINIIEAMRFYIESENIGELKRFYNEELLPESQNIINKDININLLRNIKISSLKALISSKLIKAKSLDIKVEIEILEVIEKVHMKEIDICRVIGILFDNAIEAAVLSEEKFIRFVMIKNEKYISIIIENSCPQDTPPIYVIREKGFSTKGKGRGTGLSIVNEIVKEKYSDIDTLIEIENNRFLYEIQIKI